MDNITLNGKKCIDAIPVGWLRDKMFLADDEGDDDMVLTISWLIQTWQKEQEAR